MGIFRQTRARFRIVSSETGHVVAEAAEKADSILSRMKGLLGRRELPHGEALWIEPAPSIHTLFMRFPIDAVFIDNERCITRVATHLESGQFYIGSDGGTSVVELPAGRADECQLQEGDQLIIEEVT